MAEDVSRVVEAYNLGKINFELATFELFDIPAPGGVQQQSALGFYALLAVAGLKLAAQPLEVLLAGDPVRFSLLGVVGDHIAPAPSALADMDLFHLQVVGHYLEAAGVA